MCIFHVEKIARVTSNFVSLSETLLQIFHVLRFCLVKGLANRLAHPSRSQFIKRLPTSHFRYHVVLCLMKQQQRPITKESPVRTTGNPPTCLVPIPSNTHLPRRAAPVWRTPSRKRRAVSGPPRRSLRLRSFFWLRVDPFTELVSPGRTNGPSEIHVTRHSTSLLSSTCTASFVRSG